MKFYYVYVLLNSENSFYVGYITDLVKRMHDHKTGGTRTTKNKEYELVYYEAYRNKVDALGFLKGGSGRKYLKKQLAHFLNE